MFTVTTTEHTGEVTTIRFKDGRHALNAYYLLGNQPNVKTLELRHHDAPETPVVDLRDYF